jgi:queuine tRNA-ribosyltransferase
VGGWLGLSVPFRGGGAKRRLDERPIDAHCGCPACSGGVSRAYLHHLHRTGEMLGARLNTLHNLWTYQKLMADMRAAIEAGGFEAFRRAFEAGG